MDRPLTLLTVLAVLAGIFAFVGTLVTAPATFDRDRWAMQVRATASSGDWGAVRSQSRRVVRQQPRMQEALLFWGLGEERAGTPERATSAWTRLEIVTRENIGRGNKHGRQWYYLGWALAGQGDIQGAAEAWGELVRRMPRDGQYNAACYHALAGDKEEALAAWERATAGQDRVDPAWARVDPDLELLRGDPRFETGLDRVRIRIENRTRT